MATEVASIDFEEFDNELRVIRLQGRLDIQGVNAIDTRFAFLSASSRLRAVVDLTGLDFIASIGIRSLISNAKAQQQRGGRMVLYVGSNEPVTKVLETMGIHKLIPMFADLEKARSAVLA
jgi:anti-anti-sigma factor